MKTIPRRHLQEYLNRKHGRKVRIREYRRLGSGWHNTGYRVVFTLAGKEKSAVLRFASPLGFGHDYAPDRAHAFLMEHLLSKGMPRHARSLDVGGIAGKDVVSIGDCTEFFQVIEEVEGEEYQHDFERIMGQESLEERDKQKALILSDYLARLHARTFRGSGAARSSIQRRHTRDCIGNGEMLMGVLDTYPANGLDRKRRIAIIQKAVALRETIKDMPSRVCRMHGDFHPGNIYFEKKKLLVADASRELWGSPADDLTSLGINYLWHALKQKGRFSGPFRELFDAFWGNYMRKTRDTAIGRFAPLFLAFRGTVITHPVFYKNQSGAVRKKVYRFILQVLDKGPFDYRKVDQYI